MKVSMGYVQDNLGQLFRNGEILLLLSEAEKKSVTAAVRGIVAKNTRQPAAIEWSDKMITDWDAVRRQCQIRYEAVAVYDDGTTVQKLIGSVFKGICGQLYTGSDFLAARELPSGWAVVGWEPGCDGGVSLAEQLKDIKKSEGMC